MTRKQQIADHDVCPPPASVHAPEFAINRILTNGANAVELSPKAAYIRQPLHQMAERDNLPSRRRDKEPNRRVNNFKLQ